MSTEQASEKAKETWKSAKKLAAKAGDSVQKELDKAGPALQKSLDTSMDSAGKFFNSTIKSIDTHTEKEQLELLRAYKKLLNHQSGFVDTKLKSLEERTAAKKDPQ